MSRYQIKVSETDISTIAAEGVSVLDACLEGGVALEYNCRSGECGECIATLVSGTVKELPGADPAIFNAGHRAEGKILACMCYPQSDLVLSTRLSARPPSAIGHQHVAFTAVHPQGPPLYRARDLHD